MPYMAVKEVQMISTIDVRGRNSKFSYVKGLRQA